MPPNNLNFGRRFSQINAEIMRDVDFLPHL